MSGRSFRGNSISGQYFDGKTSQARGATLNVDDEGCARIYVAGQKVCKQLFTELKVSPRLGQTPRCIDFSDGGKFETRDNEQLDQWVSQWHGSVWDMWVHKLESHWHFVALSLISVAALVWALVVYGVPALAKPVAFMLPDKVAEVISEHTLSTLNEQFFKPSQLSNSEQQRIQTHFQSLLSRYPELTIKVLFRDGGPIGANAFALPDGTLIFTDQMVALSRHDDELLAVLAHEVGHVAEKHSLQAMVRSSLMAGVLLVFTGDVSASSSWFLTAPVVLLELSHSRGFERQADDFALQYLTSADISPSNFVALMSRLELSSECTYASWSRSETPNTESEGRGSKAGLECYRELASSDSSLSGADKIPDGEDSGVKNISGYLSSHPPTQERLQKFREHRSQ